MTNKEQDASENIESQEVENMEEKASEVNTNSTANESEESVEDSEKNTVSSEVKKETVSSEIKKETFSSEIKKESASSDKDAEVSREKELAKELEATKRRYLTALADYQNLQKRTAKVQMESRDRGVADFLKKLLPVMDTLDKLMEVCSKSDLDKRVMDGLEMFSIQFSDMLTKEGLKEIEAMGKKFDPNCEEAMMNQSIPDKEDEEVIQVFEKGYTFKDQVLRCAKVVVNKK